MLCIQYYKTTYFNRKRLLQLQVNSRIIRWVESFFTDRSSCLSKCCSVFPHYYQHWGPQGSVISPVLFTFYIGEWRANSSDVEFGVKFADDTVIVGLITEDETEYQGCVDEFVSWCHACFLQLNTKKIKEIIFYFRPGRRARQQVSKITGQQQHSLILLCES